MKKLNLLVVLIYVLILVAACAPVPIVGNDIATGKTVQSVVPASDSSYRFVAGPGLPTDSRTYHLTGQVIFDAQSVVRQASPTTGYFGGFGSAYSTYMSGVITGEVLKGKTLVRILISQVEPADTDWVTSGQVVIAKFTDLKALGLVTGDQLTASCRREAEAVSPTTASEYFDPQIHTTWELDFCRLTSPVLQLKQ